MSYVFGGPNGHQPGFPVEALIPSPWVHPHVDLPAGLLAVTDPFTETVLWLPWPPPAAKHEWGHWEPAVLERAPDNTAFGLWQWVEPGDAGGDADAGGEGAPDAVCG